MIVLYGLGLAYEPLAIHILPGSIALQGGVVIVATLGCAIISHLYKLNLKIL